jgi:hypothetical protein
MGFDELSSHPFLDLEYSVPGPNTVSKLSVTLDIATSAGTDRPLQFVLELQCCPLFTYIFSLKDFLLVTGNFQQNFVCRYVEFKIFILVLLLPVPSVSEPH